MSEQGYDYCASYFDGSRKPGSCGDECQCAVHDKAYAEGERAATERIVKRLDSMYLEAEQEREYAVSSTSYLQAGAADQRMLALRNVRVAIESGELDHTDD